MVVSKPPPEIQQFIREKGGVTSSVYFKVDVMDMLTTVSEAWKIPRSAIINLAVKAYLKGKV